MTEVNSYRRLVGGMLLAGLATALIAAGPPPPASSLRYQLGGVMSGPSDLTLDLDSGRFTIEEAWPPRTKTMLRRAGRLDAGTTQRLRRQAEAAVAMGLETEACRHATTPQLPIADAIRVMTIVIRNRVTTAPDSVLCWSKAAEDLAGDAYARIHAAARGSPGV